MLTILNAAMKKGGIGATEDLQQIIAELVESNRQEHQFNRRPDQNGFHIPGYVKRVLKRLSTQDAGFIDDLEQVGLDYTLPTTQFAERAIGRISTIVGEEASRRTEAMLHEERARIRKDLMRKGWQKPATTIERSTRRILHYLLGNEYVTAGQATGILIEECGGDLQGAREILSVMKRMGLLERVWINPDGRKIAVYRPTEVGRQYNPETREIPSADKIRDRTGLLTYIHEGVPAAKADIESRTTSASVLFNAVRDGDIELRGVNYCLSEQGLEKLKGQQAGPRAAVMEYLKIHGSITNETARELTELSAVKTKHLLAEMRVEGVIAYAGPRGYVFNNGYGPQIPLIGRTKTEQVINYAASLEGLMPETQMINLFPDATPARRNELLQHITEGQGYFTRQDGMLVMTPEGAKRAGYTLPPRNGVA